ncbi:MAG: phenylalanine--tRNA ligase subunit beta [Deltaproteobacteria bacterium HGW-Deltaproteobacteria-12]|jgi:phenylalanyl-tRNA synthetase beta chain|nr:MAG: phenylalanine--tRNA ligase subunit beta [Deltaproteobacteria bacterium HGW-Deltaproteobacteria-12]
MLVSLKWLKDYVDIDKTPAELADALTMAGLEVDEIKQIKPAFSGVVTAQIISVRPHPSADKLSLCAVTDGSQTYPIVCGAKNIEAGNIVPLAKVGATIPGGLTIKSSVLRGEKSDGMLCSEAELEVGDDATGIMQLPLSTALGKPLEEILDLGDTVLDVGITPNRADCLSMIGIAREVAAITGKKLHVKAAVINEAAEDIDSLTSVKIVDSDLCPRYTARLIKDVQIGPTPVWMKTRLEAVGLRSINNVVDVTNFVMLEMGQPLHSFDFRFLEEGRIVVRKSKQDEEFISLDGKVRKLDADTLLICDGLKPVAIGGIMGGLNSEVKDDTQIVFLESAYFNPSSIRRSARKLAMSTDAAFRFERGIDPEGVLQALHRAAQLIAELSGGKVCRNYIDEYPAKVPAAKDIPLRLSRINTIIGAAVSSQDVVKILESIGMDIRETSTGHYLVTPPTYRVDITREVDLIEEVARLYGYDRVPVTLPKVSVAEITSIPRLDLEERIRCLLTGSGYTEVVNYSFISPTSVDSLSLAENDERRSLVHIKNPLVEDQSVMRTTMIYGLLDTLKKNANNGSVNLKLFEMGRTFFSCGEGKLPEERNILAGLLAGTVSEDLWNSRRNGDFYDIKGCLANIFFDLKMNTCRYRSEDTEAFLHPGKSCNIYLGESKIGYAGELHPDVQDKMDLKVSTYVFEINLDMIADHNPGGIAYKDISKYPAVTRDVAFIIEAGVETDYMLDIVLHQQEYLLENVVIFDIYAGKGLPEGTKSLGLRFSYRSPDKTLTDVEVNQVHEKIVRNVVRVTGSKVRGE